MVREDWVSIGVKKDMVKKLDDFLKTNESKRLRINSRQQALSLILKEFFDKGSITTQKNKEIEEITIERNTAQNMVDMVGKGMLDMDYVENLKHEKTKNGVTTIKDKKLGRSVDIVIRDDFPYCTHHKSTWCNHISYLFYILTFLGLKNIVKKK